LELGAAFSLIFPSLIATVVCMITAQKLASEFLVVFGKECALVVHGFDACEVRAVITSLNNSVDALKTATAFFSLQVEVHDVRYEVCIASGVCVGAEVVNLFNVQLAILIPGDLDQNQVLDLATTLVIVIYKVSKQDTLPVIEAKVVFFTLQLVTAFRILLQMPLIPCHLCAQLTLLFE